MHPDLGAWYALLDAGLDSGECVAASRCEEDRGAALGEGAGGRFADAARCAGDEYDLWLSTAQLVYPSQLSWTSLTLPLDACASLAGSMPG